MFITELLDIVIARQLGFTPLVAWSKWRKYDNVSSSLIWHLTRCSYGGNDGRFLKYFMAIFQNEQFFVFVVFTQRSQEMAQIVDHTKTYWQFTYYLLVVCCVFMKYGVYSIKTLYHRSHWFKYAYFYGIRDVITVLCDICLFFMSFKFTYLMMMKYRLFSTVWKQSRFLYQKKNLL